MLAPNTLSQRSMARPSRAVVRLDGGELRHGGSAGLGHTSSSPSAVLVESRHGQLRLSVHGSGEVITGPAVPKALWLCTDLDERAIATFGYSFDGVEFIAIGASYPTVWSHYRGSRIALYCFAEQSDAGFAVFSQFRYGPTAIG
jgi:hypothetical protein